MAALEKVYTDKRGFATKLTPVTNGGMLRHAVSIEDNFNDLLNGNLAIRRLLMTAASTLTISGGSITTTLNQHIVAAETGVADDLDNITAANNKFVFLKADAGDTITIRHGVGNISVPGGNYVILTGSRGALLYCDGGNWGVICSTTAKTNLTATADPATGDDVGDGYGIGSVWLNRANQRVWYCVDKTLTTARWIMITPWKDQWSIRAAASTVQSVGIAAPTTDYNGNFNQSTGTLVSVSTGGTPNTSKGLVTATFDLVRPYYDPILEAHFWSSVSVVTNMRFWFGLISTGVTNVDTLASGTKFIGFRYSTVAGDTGLVPVLNDGTTQTNGTAIGTMTANTNYRMRFRVNSSLSTVYFSVNEGAEQALSTNFPAGSTDLGFTTRVINTDAVSKDNILGYVKVMW